ncbi:hypothetical protein RI367_000211 [Sorochytrium milnesiophthora]
MPNLTAASPLYGSAPGPRLLTTAQQNDPRKLYNWQPGNEGKSLDVLDHARVQTDYILSNVSALRRYTLELRASLEALPAELPKDAACSGAVTAGHLRAMVLRAYALLHNLTQLETVVADEAPPAPTVSVSASGLGAVPEAAEPNTRGPATAHRGGAGGNVGAQTLPASSTTSAPPPPSASALVSAPRPKHTRTAAKPQDSVRPQRLHVPSQNAGFSKHPCAAIGTR